MAVGVPRLDDSPPPPPPPVHPSAPPSPAGRGRSPAPFELVDHLRYAAYLLAEARDWPAARLAFGDLLARVDAEDWAFLSGAAYCWAAGLAAEVEGALLLEPGDSADRILALLAPWASGGAGADGAASSVPLCGNAGIDARLGATLADSLALAASLGSPVATAASLPDLSPRRGSLLALLLSVATRAELAHRLLARPLPSVALASALPSLLAALSAQYVSLCAAFVAGVGHKACAFIDLRDALLPVLPALPTRGAAAAGAAGGSPPGSEPPEAAAAPPVSPLSSFLSARPKLVAVPFDSPVQPAGECCCWCVPSPQPLPPPISLSPPVAHWQAVPPREPSLRHSSPGPFASPARRCKKHRCSRCCGPGGPQSCPARRSRSPSTCCWLRRARRQPTATVLPTPRPRRQLLRRRPLQSRPRRRRGLAARKLRLLLLLLLLRRRRRWRRRPWQRWTRTRTASQLHSSLRRTSPRRPHTRPVRLLRGRRSAATARPSRCGQAVGGQPSSQGSSSCALS